MGSREWECQGERKFDLLMHASIFVITLSLPYHLIFLFSFEFIFSFLSRHFLSTSCHSFLLPSIPYSWLPLSFLYLLKFMGFLPLVPKDVPTTFGIFPRLPTSLLVAWPLPLLKGCLPHHSPFPNKNSCFVLSRSLPCLPSTDKGWVLSIPTTMACIKWS